MRFGITRAERERQRVTQPPTCALQFASVAVVALLTLKRIQRAHYPQQIPYCFER